MVRSAAHGNMGVALHTGSARSGRSCAVGTRGHLGEVAGTYIILNACFHSWTPYSAAQTVSVRRPLSSVDELVLGDGSL